jgi:hypothetical protein
MNSLLQDLCDWHDDKGECTMVAGFRGFDRCLCWKHYTVFMQRQMYYKAHIESDCQVKSLSDIQMALPLTK